MASPNFNLFPPTPPSNFKERNNHLSLIHPDTIPNLYSIENTNIIPGKFGYIKDESTKIMLVTAWKAITMLELWDFVEEEDEAYMISTNPKVFEIYRKIEELGYNGHSGSSFAFIMRIMQYIAKYGEAEFKKINT